MRRGNSVAAVAAKGYTYRLYAWRPYDAAHADGVTEERQRLVYEDVPCLIKRGGGRSGVGRRAVLAPGAYAAVPDVREAYLVFAAPDILLEENDRVKIMGAGMCVEGNTGASFAYPSHTETVINVQKRA